MQSVGLKHSDVKINLRLRDFIVDFLSCLIPGFVFLLIATVMVFGLVVIIGKYLTGVTLNDLSAFQTVSNLLENIISIRFWSYIIIIVLSYVVGHLLYRQDPKEPDYVSFINIREKVMGYNPWVIASGDGLTPKDVQFPYSNLAQYLNARGFDYLAQAIDWKPKFEGFEKGRQRSKAFVNKLKTRIAFFFPENTLNIIRNEAHIRLASSMWYASKYTVGLAYYSVTATILIFIVVLLYFPDKIENHIYISLFVFPLLALFILMSGIACKQVVEGIIKKKEKEKNDNNSKIYEMKPEDREKQYKSLSRVIRMGFKWYDRAPLFATIILLITSYLVWKKNLIEMQGLMPSIFVYTATILFFIIGILYIKHRIEKSFHYQRVREIIYVLETAYLGKVLREYQNTNIPF